MSGASGAPTGREEVLGRQAPGVRLVRLQLVTFTLLAALWVPRAVAEPEAMHVVMAALSLLGLCAYVGLAVSGSRVALVLDGDRLEVRRRWRPLSVARHDVVAVRGDVPGRPTWSEHVLVQTRDGTVRLPPLDRAPAELVARLQGWAGVGEEFAG